ncbi:MAG: hypothetical protein KDF64_15645 [Geminicoccaceae bacterium]|nr:hypothetical protein [Geminicoccaceae bacterium]
MRSTGPGIATLIVATLVVAIPAIAPADTLPPASLRCETLAGDVAVTPGEFRLLVEFCEALGIEEDQYGPANNGQEDHAASADDRQPDYFVKCRVEGDPEWIGFRLVTRRQCEAARGTAATR